jgi:hypothetical protein
MIRRLTAILVILFVGTICFAQQYPVQGSLAIASPYPVNLSDYANSNLQNLVFNATLTDVSMSNKRVRLKLFIQTQNATIAQSTDNVEGEPMIMLDGGIPQRLTNAELAPYFRLNNLQNIAPDAYAQPLPEGIYTFGFEVYDYFTGRKLSTRISQTFWLIINNPPLLNTPQDKSKIADFTSMGGAGGIVFNWTPRSTQVSNTEYEFTLCELWDPAGDPYQQFMAAIPKYQTTVSNTTTLIYTQAQPPLVSGYSYAWRVRAKAKAGFEDVGLYRNDGYSNLFTFRYGDPCPAPQSLALEAKTSDQISATWQAPLASLGGASGGRYKLAYRKYSVAGQWNWAETETSDLFRTISDLEPATEYEIKVGVPCASPTGGQAEVIYTPSQRATTLAAGQITGIECGKEPTIDLGKQTLLPLLKAGDVVMANDFPTTITRVAGTSQGWSGEGWTKVPWLADTRIHVTYASIKVNTDYKLIDGSFITTYDPTGKNIGDVDKMIDDAVGLYTGGTDVGKVVTGADATAYTVPYTITPADTVGSTFTANTTGGGIITLASGQTIEMASVPATVQDAAGNIYQANKDGKLTKVGSTAGNGATMLAAANLTVVDASKGSVTFAPTSDMKYAFDAWQKAYDGNSTWSKRYETLPINGQSGKYRVSSKLMVPGEADKVLAMVNLNNKSLVPDSIRFVNGKGTQFEKKKITDNSYELSLVGGPAGDAQEVYALYPLNGKTYTLGKLLVATYEPKTINLALVPVNGATLNSEAIAAELKKAYEPLGVDFNISIKDKFEYLALETASLKVEGSSLFSVYTDQMKALNSAYVSTLGSDYQTNTVYLFGIPQGAGKDGNTTLLGDMPRGKQFGYLFTQGQTAEQQGVTTAHEIGHGVFQLQHVFDYSGIAQRAITPTNIMDYPAGEAFSKLQWDLMHDPGLVISVFETDKGAELLGQYWLTPDWKPFKYNASNSICETSSYTTKGPIYTITGVEDGKYTSKCYAYNSATKKYLYNNNEADFLNIESQAVSDNTPIYIIDLKAGECGKYYQTTWGYIKDKKGVSIYFEKDANVHFVNNVQCSTSKFASQQEEQEANEFWQFFQKCYQGYKTQEGYVPRCLWDHNNYVPNGIFGYYVNDPAFTSGIIDGLIETGDGALDLIKFVDCYNPLSFRAWTDKCYDTRDKTYNVLKQIYQLVSNKEKLNEACKSVKEKLGDYTNETAGVDNQARYNQGKIVFNVASLFIGVGEAKALINGEKTLLTVIKEGLTAYASLPSTILKLSQKAGREGVAYIALKTGSKGAYLGYKLANTEIRLADVTAQQVFANIEWATKNGIILERLEDVKYLDATGKQQNGILELIKQEDGKLGVKTGSVVTRFVAKSSNELEQYLVKLTDLPKGETYTGDLYRSLSINSEKEYLAVPEKMTPHDVYSSWGRYDLKGEENAMYLSKTLPGNKTELSTSGEWKDFSTYRFENIKADNLLDLTDDAVRQKLGTQFDDLTRVYVEATDELTKLKNYEMTNVIAKWARQKGYNGIIAPGARGTKDYQNIILFDQIYIDNILENKTPIKILK